MMKSFYFSKLGILCLTAIAFALPANAQSTKNLHLNNFSEVSASAGIEVFIIQGTSESEKIVANPDVIDEVIVEKSGNTIKVGWKEHWGFNKMWKDKKAKVYITYKNLKAISASSGSSLKTLNTLKTNHLDASVSSGGSIEAKIVCGELVLNTSSGGSAEFTGIANNMTVESSSGGAVNATALATEYARAEASSGGDIKINVTKALETTTSSGGSIHYKGNARLKDNSERRTSGVSRI